MFGVASGPPPADVLAPVEALFSELGAAAAAAIAAAVVQLAMRGA